MSLSDVGRVHCLVGVHAIGQDVMVAQVNDRRLEGTYVCVTP